MDDVALVAEIGALLLIAALAGNAARRLGLPAVIGYLAIGLAVGPFTPGYVTDPDKIRLLTNVGVVLLLFEVGLGTDPRSFRRRGTPLLAAVVLQVALTVALAAVALIWAGSDMRGAITIGLALAVSSTVVALNISRSKRRTIDEASAGSMVLWSVVQDVLTILGVAVLAAFLTDGSATSIAASLVGLVAFAVIAVLVGSHVVPRLLRAVRGEADTFLVVVVSVAFVTAGIGALAFGVPLALAAFVSGVAVGHRSEAAEAQQEILPFRDLFAVLFFVGIGTLIDPAALLRGGIWPLIALLVVLKGAIIWALVKLLRMRIAAAHVAIGLAQIGEFSFVVLSIGLAAGVIDAEQFAAVLAVAVVSIAASTIGARWSPPQRRRA